MFHLTWAGMLGRKKESSLLLIVLALSFLLSSALAIVLPSTQAGIQLQRQKTYGSWQLMLYGESDSVCDAMAQAAQARGAKSAFLPTVGVTSDDEIISEIRERLSAFDFRADIGEAFQVVEQIFQYIADNRDFCSLLLSEKGDFSFQKRVTALFQEQYAQQWQASRSTDPETVEYLYRYVITGSIGILQNWLKSGMRKSPGGKTSNSSRKRPDEPPSSATVTTAVRFLVSNLNARSAE